MELADLPLVLQNLTWLDFEPQTDCAIAEKCLGEALGEDDPAPLTLIGVEFARACAPSPVSLADISYEEMVDWNAYVFLNKNISVLNLTDQANLHCHRDLCRGMKFEGNADLSGIGIFAAYWMQLGFTMIFIIIYLSLDVASYRRRRAVTPQTAGSQPAASGVAASSPTARRTSLLSAAPWSTAAARRIAFLDNCLKAYWISSFYFGLGTGLATGILVYRGGGKYDRTFSSLGGIFSTSVLGSLWPWYRRSLAPKTGHRQAAYLYIFVVMILFYCVPFFLDLTQKHRPQQLVSSFDKYCFSALDSWSGKNFVAITVTSTIGGFIFVFASYQVIKGKLEPDDGRDHTPSILFAWAMGLYSFCMMWTSLIFFWLVRSEVVGLVDETDFADNEMGFGQILAIVAWIPLLFEWLKVFLADNPKDTKEERPSPPGDGGSLVEDLGAPQGVESTRLNDYPAPTGSPHGLEADSLPGTTEPFTVRRRATP